MHYSYNPPSTYIYNYIYTYIYIYIYPKSWSSLVIKKPCYFHLVRNYPKAHCYAPAIASNTGAIQAHRDATAELRSKDFGKLRCIDEAERGLVIPRCLYTGWVVYPLVNVYITMVNHHL